MPWTVLYVCSATGRRTAFAFRTEADGKQWLRDVDEIKLSALAMSGMSRLEGDKACAEWVVKVQFFAQRIGKDYVPLDIRTALNNNQEYLGMPVTSWLPQPPLVNSATT